MQLPPHIADKIVIFPAVPSVKKQLIEAGAAAGSVIVVWAQSL